MLPGPAPRRQKTTSRRHTRIHSGEVVVLSQSWRAPATGDFRLMLAAQPMKNNLFRRFRRPVRKTRKGSSTNLAGAGVVWNRAAYLNESVTFDPGLARQPQDGTHHYHANPIALRYLLGDHVEFNALGELKTPSTRIQAPMKFQARSSKLPTSIARRLGHKPSSPRHRRLYAPANA